MGQSMGMADFFAMEASDYLERLDTIVSSTTPPETREFIRLTRALRGSAIMAGQQSIARVAAGLESMSRGLDESRLAWVEAIRQLAIRAVDDLKVLVRAVPSWSTGDEARAQKIAAELEQASGRETRPHRAEPQTAMDAGTRAFIAREGAAVGSALDRAARALAMNPGAVDSLTAVSRAMQPLRGIASLSDLPPLPDLLEGIDRAVQEVIRHPEALARSRGIFDAAAKAVSRAAQEISTRGKASADSPDAQAFATLLGDLLEPDEAVVSTEGPGHGDQGPQVESGAAPPQPMDQLELVSHAEYLKQFADELERSQTDTQRTLRTHALAPTLRALAAGSGGPLADSAASMARATRDAVVRGAAVEQPAELAGLLREAGTTLSAAAQGSETGVREAMARLIDAIQGLAQPMRAPAEPPAAPRIPAPETPFARPEPAPPQLVAQPEPAFVPETVAPPPQPAQPVAAEPPPPTPSIPTEPEPAGAGAGTEAGGLADSFDTYQRMLAEQGAGPGTLEELLGQAPVTPTTAAPEPPPPAPAEPALSNALGRSSPAAVPGDSDFTPTMPEVPRSTGLPDVELAAAAAAPAARATPAPRRAPFEKPPEIAPITAYCYSGTAALERAISLRDEVRTALTAGADREPLVELLEEIFDLIQLGAHRPS